MVRPGGVKLGQKLWPVYGTFVIKLRPVHDRPSIWKFLSLYGNLYRFWIAMSSRTFSSWQGWAPKRAVQQSFQVGRGGHLKGSPTTLSSVQGWAPWKAVQQCFKVVRGGHQERPSNKSFKLVEVGTKKIRPTKLSSWQRWAPKRPSNNAFKLADVATKKAEFKL